MSRCSILFALMVVSVLWKFEMTPAAEPPSSHPSSDSSSDQDTAIHVPTPHDIVAKMLEAAKVTRDDLLCDLGCGDGRIVIAAASKYGCKAVGYDIDARKVRESRDNVKARRLERLVRIERRDIFALDLSKATVITLYLLPEMNVQLIPQLQRLRDGSRIVTHDFPIEGIQYDRKISMESSEDGGPHDIYLYELPLKADRVVRNSEAQ